MRKPPNKASQPVRSFDEFRREALHFLDIEMADMERRGINRGIVITDFHSAVNTIAAAIAFVFTHRGGLVDFGESHVDKAALRKDFIAALNL